ncbi:YcaO-like family protein [Ruania suaedae]|uniref:YcaO-like family protein n=1 Tax=Ruania suaedae TaxID=2897774 RepID=UPI001E463476|nr:YcaO-like family protein [Ruania suaedae]UFU01924.1 YcaO-like family protein [Ruania suaedae]
MRLAVHALGEDRVLACRDDGRRWVLGVGAGELGQAAARTALTTLAEEGPALPAPPLHRDHAVASLTELEHWAAALDGPGGAGAGDQVVRWPFAGSTYRMCLRPGRAGELVRAASQALRARIPEPEHARALAGRAVLVLTAPEPAPGSPGPAPAPGMLERWTGQEWQPHALVPPAVVDPVTGLVHRVVRRRDPHAPGAFVHLHAELPHLSSVDPRWQPDPLAPAGTLEAADGERVAVLSGLAHLCGAYQGQGERRQASTRELINGGARVLTVGQWRPHDPALHTQPGFPFRPHEQDLSTWWLRGREHPRDGAPSSPCWVPLSLVHAGYLASALAGLPATNSHNLVGLQAGRNAREALDRAAAELLAQDAVARWWYDGGPSLPEVPLPAPVAARDSMIALRMLAVPSATGLPVRLAVADDGDVLALGYAGAAGAEEAASGAVCAALIQHASARDLTRRDSLIRRGPELGNGGVAGLAPYDSGRRYASAFAGRHLMVDPMCHLQRGLDPVVADRVRVRTRPAPGAGPEPEAAAPPAPMPALLSLSPRVVSVDVTTDRVRAAGFCAHRLLATGLRRLTVAAFPQHVTDAREPYPGW